MGRGSRIYGALALALGVGMASPALARPGIRDAFFSAYPSAVGSTIDTVPSHPGHCGVCHYAFGGGGPRNLYGQRLEVVLGDFPNNPNGKRQAVLSIGDEDPDGDGFSTNVEVTDTTTFSNTPTFPGLTPANVGNVTEVTLSEIQQHLVPSTGSDTTPPQVTLISPNGGEILEANGPATVEWTATDASGIAAIELYLSDDGGATYRHVAEGLQNTGSYTWYPANRPTVAAVFRVEAIDNAFNEAYDDSDSFFEIDSPPGGIVPTTLRDFDQPGSQPFEAGTLNPPTACAPCHGNYDPTMEPYFNWRGSMMSQASRDPLFEACLAVANQDAPDSGDLCLRCHLPRGWLRGRSVPTDGSQMLATDAYGVTCDLCHRLVDPFFDPTANPAIDEDILNELVFPPVNFGNGMFVVDPTGARRGPFIDATSGHAILVSPFHREAALCGSCHDVSNPAFEKDASGNYLPNTFDETSPTFSAHTLMPIERTYSEWFNSDYNSLSGVYAPEFGGNKDFVATCQDCHLRDITGQACNLAEAPTRTDLPLHDMTGGSTWLPGLLADLYPADVDPAALNAGIGRARYMLQNAASMSVEQQGSTILVTVTNETGHKLPTGYPEGRRMWINVRFYDDQLNLIKESAAYDATTGDLAHDAEAKIYEAKPGLDSVTAPIVGVPEGPSFHFVLNNKIFKDNRIPPRGFTNAAFDSFGGAPVGHAYADGQHWDVTSYDVPSGATSVEVNLYYQSTSKEYVGFLDLENFTNSAGQAMFDLWNNNGKCPPEMMQAATLAIETTEACCNVDGTCSEATSTDCLAAGGTPQGPGSTCEGDLDGDGYDGACEACPDDPDKIDPGLCGCGVPDTDTDNDGTPDCDDLCPNDPNKIDPGLCGCGVPDTDSDNDGTPDCNDNCPNDPDKTEPGLCGCGVPDTDSDNDGTPDCNDNCPNDPDKTEPGVCGCGVPDVDSDNDGTLDCNDGCPDDPDKIAPGICGCGVPDTDSDNDGTPDCHDNCPNDPDKIEPGVCGCGTPDTDSDNDGTPDCNDNCPNDPDKTEPGVCGCGVPDTDSDNDGTPDCNDNCPDDPDKTEPGICGCGVPDTDSDNDGTPDCNDNCPNDPGKTEPGICGCGVPDVDSDNDGTLDCNDGCPNDTDKTEPGICGCGVPDTDSDNDGTPDCNDGCANDPDKTEPGLCGCGVPDTDSDNDGTPDCNDNCPDDPDKTEPGVCGCGVPDTDSDSDGTPDCNDNCPDDPGKTEPGVCGCGVSDADSDNDGTPDCNDNCPDDPDKTEPGICGCGVSDLDSDNDGTPDCNDGCPNDPDKTEPGICGCGVPDVDTDNDTVLDCNDNCPNDPNPGQEDSDGDGVGDACDLVVTPEPLRPDPTGIDKNRFVSFAPPSAGPEPSQTAIQVVITRMYVDSGEDPINGCPVRTTQPDLSQFDGIVRWVGPPGEYSEFTTPPIANFLAAPLVCCPYFRDWSDAALAQDFGPDANVSVLHIYGVEAVPCSTYELRAVDSSCPDPFDPGCLSEPLVVRTAQWGDVVDPLGGIGQPNFGDISAEVAKYKGQTPPQGPITARSLLRENAAPVGQQVNFIDISLSVDGYKRIPYRQVGPDVNACSEPCP